MWPSCYTSLGAWIIVGSIGFAVVRTTALSPLQPGHQVQKFLARETTLPLWASKKTPAEEQLNAPLTNASPWCQRRAMLWGAGGAALGLWSPKASAFANKISTQYDDRPKQYGSKPKDLGVARQKKFNDNGDDDDDGTYLGLKECRPSPNCFCSTLSVPDDPDHAIPAWRWPDRFRDDTEAVMKELRSVVDSYPPGQNNVDGGGFEIQTYDAEKGYLYVQFESLKNHYIDDVEFAILEGGADHAVQVRSSSRLGYLDFGVNAKRLNWLAAALRAKGWQAEGVDYATHVFYATENQLN